MTDAVIKRRSGSTEYYKDGKLVREEDPEGKQVVRIMVEPTKSGKGIKRSKKVETQRELQVSKQVQAEQESISAQAKPTGVDVRVEGRVNEGQLSRFDYRTQAGLVQAEQLTPTVRSLAEQRAKEQLTPQQPTSTSFQQSTGYPTTSSLLIGESSRGRLPKDPDYIPPRTFKEKLYDVGDVVFQPFGRVFQKTGIIKGELVNPKGEVLTGVRATRGGKRTRKVLETAAQKPFSTAFLVTGGKYVASKPLASAKVLGATGTGVVAVDVAGKQIAKSQAKEFTQLEDYQSILTKAFAKEREKVSKFNVAYEISPSFASKETKQAFTESVYKQLKSKGFKTEEAEKLTRQAYKFRQITSTSAGIQTGIAVTGAERLGSAILGKGLAKSVFKPKSFKLASKVAVASIPAGQFEGAVQETISSKATFQPVKGEKLVSTATIGGVVSGAASFTIVKTGKGETVANILDPSEAVGEAGARLTTRGTRRISTITPTISFPQTISSEEASLPKPSRLSAKEITGDKNIVDFSDLAIKPSKTPSFSPSKPLITSSFSPSTSRTEPSRIDVPSRTDPISKTTPTVVTDGKRLTRVPPQVPTTVATTSKTTTKSKTTPSVFTPQFKGFIPPPIFPKGSGLGFRRTTRKTSSQTKTYTPSAFALATGLRSTKASSKTLTGFSIRPIIERATPKKKTTKKKKQDGTRRTRKY